MGGGQTIACMLVLCASLQLYKLAQSGFQPARFFSIDRVFRNEAIDRTHLAEFHQVEGRQQPQSKASQLAWQHGCIVDRLAEQSDAYARPG